MTKENVAQICHEANKGLCATQGDFTQTEWAIAPEWQKDSAIMGVEFHLANPDANAEDSHNSWLKVKEDDGWKYGPVKNPDLKEHPCFLPFGELPESQQAKDHLFKGIVHALAKFVN